MLGAGHCHQTDVNIVQYPQQRSKLMFYIIDTREGERSVCVCVYFYLSVCGLNAEAAELLVPTILFLAFVL